MYKLIGLPMTRAIRVIWCLEELGLEYEIDPAGPQSDAIKAVNPSGKVPALIDRGDIIIDSAAICQYLADKHGALTFAAGSIERGQMDSWVHFATGEVDASCWVWAKHDFLLPEELRLSAVKPICADEFARAMQAMEVRLGDNEYVMGDTFTVPDIILGHCANWAQNGCGFSIPAGPLEAYFKRVRSRPAYERAMAVRNTYAK